MKSMIRILTISLVTVLLFMSCKEDQPSKPSDMDISYSTNLIDSRDNPVINAIVNIHETDKSDVIATDTSDEDGFISFDKISVPTENITFSISHPLYNSLNLNYSDIDNKKNGSVTLEDKKDCCGSIELTIKDKDGNVLKNVEVKVRQNKELLKKGTSDENGKVKFEGLCLEEYNLRLALDGYKVIEETINIENCDDTKLIDFKMISTQSDEDTCCDGVFIFKPKDKDGNILNGTKVYIYKDGKVIEDPLVENGSAVQDSLCEGKYTIVYKLDGYENKEVQVEIGCDEEKTLEHTLEKKSDCCDGKVKIIVKDDKGNVLKNAAVRLWKGKNKLTELKTDANGYIEFKELCESNEYSISIFADGFEEFEFGFDLACNKELSFEKKLTTKEDCCDAILKFIVKDNKTKSSLEDAKITLKLNGKVILEKKLTDSEGEFLAKELCIGNYTVIIEKDGYKRIETSWKIENCDTFQETFSMEPISDCCNGKVKITVKDENGNVLKGVTVRLWKGSKQLTELKTDANGYIEFKELCESNEYSISILSEEYEGQEFKFEIGCDKELTFEKKLKVKSDCCDAILKFIVKDSKTKSALEGAKITLKLNGKVIFEKKATDKEGEFLAKELCKGKYTVIIEKDGYNRIETSWNIEKCDTFQETFSMEPINNCCDGFVRVKVTDENGNLLRNKTVNIWKGSTKLKDAKTNDNGIVEFGDLCEGNDYSISIVSEEHEGVEFKFELGCNKELNFEKSMKTKKACCDAILKFIVKDSKTKSVLEGAKITLKLDGKVIFEKKATDKEGEFLAKELCKGKYTVIIEKDGYNRIETSWNVEKCDTFQETFSMEPISDCCDAVLKFIVMDNETKSAIEGAKITLKLNGKVIYEKKATDKEGEYLAKELCKGKYTVIIEKDGYNTIETTWNVEKCDTFQEHFWMKK